jgi:drug/metabolite transporter (DMT)-like permease
LAHLPPIVSAAGTLSFSTVLMAAVVCILERPWRLSMPSATAVAALVLLAVVSSGVASLVFFRLLQSAGATNSSLVTLLMPVTAILLGVLVLGERLSLRQAAGIALVGLALLVIDGRLTAFLPQAGRRA